MINKLFLASTTDFWGTEQINPPGGTTDFGRILSVGINVAIVIGGVAIMIWALWGALDWITAGGTKDQLEKAQAKIRNAFFGAIVLIIVMVIWTFVTGSLLGILRLGPGIGIFKVPSLGNGSVDNGITGVPGYSCSPDCPCTSFHRCTGTPRGTCQTCMGGGDCVCCCH